MSGKDFFAKFISTKTGQKKNKIKITAFNLKKWAYLDEAYSHCHIICFGHRTMKMKLLEKCNLKKKIIVNCRCVQHHMHKVPLSDLYFCSKSYRKWSYGWDILFTLWKESNSEKFAPPVSREFVYMHNRIAMLVTNWLWVFTRSD